MAGRRWRGEEEKEGEGRSSVSVSILRKRKELQVEDEKGSVKKKRNKRKRDDTEEAYEIKMCWVIEKKVGEGQGERGGVVAVVEKRKTDDVTSEMAVSKESFDDDSKLMRTVFVGNLLVKTKRTSLLKEFAVFGEVESVSIRSVPLIDSRIPRKAAIIKEKINGADWRNHIRVDMAYPPRKKPTGEDPVYGRKRTVSVGNLPFDVKHAQLYQLFHGVIQSMLKLYGLSEILMQSLGKGMPVTQRRR